MLVTNENFDTILENTNNIRHLIIFDITVENVKIFLNKLSVEFFTNEFSYIFFDGNNEVLRNILIEISKQKQSCYQLVSYNFTLDLKNQMISLFNQNKLEPYVWGLILEYKSNEVSLITTNLIENLNTLENYYKEKLVQQIEETKRQEDLAKIYHGFIFDAGKKNDPSKMSQAVGQRISYLEQKNQEQTQTILELQRKIDHLTNNPVLSVQYQKLAQENHELKEKVNSLEGKSLKKRKRTTEELDASLNPCSKKARFENITNENNNSVTKTQDNDSLALETVLELDTTEKNTDKLATTQSVQISLGKAPDAIFTQDTNVMATNSHKKNNGPENPMDFKNILN